MNTRAPGEKKPSSSEVAMERDRVSSRLIEQERLKTQQKTARLRALRLAHEQTLRVAQENAPEPAPKAASKAGATKATAAKPRKKASAAE